MVAQSQFIEMFRTAPKEHVHLKDIATYSIGLTYKPENVKPSGIPVLRSGNIQEESLDFGDLVRVDSSIPDTLLLQDGDILMCSRNGSAHLVGKVARIRQLPEPMTYGAFMTVIRSEYMDYLFLFFQSDGFRQQISYGKSSTMNQITQKMLDQITLDLPSKAEIKKLSPLLEQADKSKFDGLKSQFIEMFGLPSANHKAFKIGCIADIVSDIHYGTSRQSVENGDYPYLRMNNITYTGELDLSDLKRISIPEEELSGCIVKKGDVLFNRTNSKDLVGKTCSFPFEQPMVIAGYIIRLRMNGLVLPEYLSVFLNLSCSKKMLRDLSKGAVGQANINAKEVQSITILIPPIELQNQFVVIKNQADKSKYLS